MDENNPFSNYGPDPFLPFLNNYEEQFQPTEQDSWANAHFGFDGTQDLSFFSNPGFMNSLDILRPFVPDTNQLAYSNQETSNPGGVPTSHPTGLSHPPTTESSLPALASTPTSSGSPAPPSKKPRSTTSRKTSHPLSPSADPSDKESLLLNKRARNLVASAKFREKKKQREADLERTAREMTEKALALEKKVEELEGQIKLLRSLLLDKTSL